MKKIGGLKKGLMYAMVTTMITSGAIGMTSLNASAATSGTVNASALNVRSGAGTGYSWVGTVRQGQTVTIVDSVKASDGYTWYKISGTTSGYVRGDYISNVVSESVTSSTGKVTADVLNVRTGAGRNYSVMGTTSYGTRLTVIATSGEWYKVTCKIKDNSGSEKVRTGYVHRDYVKLESGSNASTGSSSNSGSTNNSGSGSTSSETVIATGVVNVSALNLRSGAGTGNSAIAVLGYNTSLDILSQSGSWYKVRCTVNGSTKTGYVHSDYVTKTATNDTTTQVSGTGVVNADALNVRSGAGKSHSVVFVIRQNTKVEILSQVGNWYNIKCTYGGQTKTGFVAAEYITRTTAATPTPTPPVEETKQPETESKAPETESKAPETEAPTVKPETPEFTQVNGVLNANEVRVRSKASLNSQTYAYVNKGTKVIVIGEEGDWYKVKVVINGATKEGYIYAEYVTIQKESSGNSSNSGSGNSGSTDNNTSADTHVGILTGDCVYLRSGPGTGYSRLGSFGIGSYVTILGKEGDWYKVSGVVSGSVKEGYVFSQWIKPMDAHNDAYDGEKDDTFEAEIAAFPESYKNALRRLHDEHPDWTFVAYNTGLDFNDVLAAQYNGELSMIYFDKDTTPYSWLSTKPGDYDWATDTYANRDGASWKSASKEVLAYYLDPRNFLLEGEIFMFESMDYSESQSRDIVADILKGSYMTDGKTYTYNGKTYTYVDTFMEAGQIAKVSPYILASRSRQEIGSGSGSVTGGTYYNFYNIGANASASGNAVSNALNYAASGTTWRRPWTNPWLAIVGGAEFLSESYIAKGQNTDYFQKFNVVTAPYHQHQYMGNIQAPAKEGASRYGSYKDNGVLDANFTFVIPVYSNMPEKACQMPIEAGNPNGYLKSLSVSGMSLNQTFKYDITDYYGATNQSSVTISASKISSHAQIISGTGTHSLKMGENQIVVVCQAGNGDQVSYTLNITRY